MAATASNIVRPRVPYRRLFLIAAWTHLLAGVAGLIMLPSYFRELGISAQTSPVLWQAVCVTTTCFGLAGFWIARDTQRNRDLIQLWLLVKAAIVVLTLWNLRVGSLRPLAGILVAVDAIWIAALTSVLVGLGQPSDS